MKISEKNSFNIFKCQKIGKTTGEVEFFFRKITKYRIFEKNRRIPSEKKNRKLQN